MQNVVFLSDYVSPSLSLSLSTYLRKKEKRGEKVWNSFPVFLDFSFTFRSAFIFAPIHSIHDLKRESNENVRWKRERERGKGMSSQRGGGKERELREKSIKLMS